MRTPNALSWLGHNLSSNLLPSKEHVMLLGRPDIGGDYPWPNLEFERNEFNKNLLMCLKLFNPPYPLCTKLVIYRPNMVSLPEVGLGND